MLSSSFFLKSQNETQTIWFISSLILIWNQNEEINHCSRPVQLLMLIQIWIGISIGIKNENATESFIQIMLITMNIK